MSPEALDTVAGRYVLEEPIAHGGMAAVWKARDEVLARFVALKILNEGLSEDPSFLERFRTEALAAARLSHPNVVQTFDTGLDEAGRHFIVMEYCQGGTLADLVAREGPLPPGRAVAITGHICDALAYAHRHGVVHRDIKPGNVLIGVDGAIKVGDFGIAKAAFASKDITTTGQVLGTVTYLSPEQARGEEPDGRSDIYSTGVLLYELLTGRPPFEGETAVATALSHIEEPARSPGSVKGGIPRSLDTAVLRALAKDVDDRYTTADEMRRALEEACAPTRSVVPPAPAQPREESADDEPGIGRVLALIAAIVLIALLVAYVAGESPRPPASDEAGNDSSTILRVAATDDYDPYGDGAEHPDEVGLAVDGKAATAWTTEDYEDSLEILDKPGVGLVFDLGREVSPEAIEIVLAPAGSDIEVRTADDVASSEEDFELVDEEADAGETLEVDPSGAVGRYWLVWITDLPGGGGGSAGIAEVRFLR